jgi:soluble lytic murein transglycosylase-like protein
MDNDKTVLVPKFRSDEELDSDRTILLALDALSVRLRGADGKDIETFSFVHDFTAGRAPDNDIVIDSNMVSRHHLAVKRERGGWWIHNLKSVNGVYVNDDLIEDSAPLDFPISISFGHSGISLAIDKSSRWPGRPEHNAQEIAARSLGTAGNAQPATSHRGLSQEEIKARLLAEEEAQDAGDYTRMVRRLIHEDRAIRKKSYKKAIWALGVLVFLSISLATYQQFALSNARRLAIEMFYDIKTLEVSLSKADIKLEESADALEETVKAIADEKLKIVQDRLRAEQEAIAAEKLRMEQERTRLASMKAKYREYVKEAKSLRLRFPTVARYEEELVAKVASELGESELELPDGFVSEVRKYIQYWQGSSRMQKAMDTVEKNNYLPVVIAALRKHGLPLHFVYLPLQESNYDAAAIGPETRFGIAKGAWQLLPTTAQQYGVSAGPLANVTEYDPQDARFDFAQSTQAGTRYLRHIYGTEAQASGLLVMASYNYGDNRVRRMIREMPDNPRDRNFWKFIQHHELPKETHDYVFYIFSAAVIGEDPQHFGFRFNPLLFKADAGATGATSVRSATKTH